MIGDEYRVELVHGNSGSKHACGKASHLAQDVSELLHPATELRENVCNCNQDDTAKW
jgi:hypothetical protein